MERNILSPEQFLAKAKNIKLLLMDCDGVLTDGKLYFSKDGEELKVFDVKDGQGINNWHKAGFESGIITGRNSVMLEKRAEELGIHYLKQNSKNKISDFNEILLQSDISKDEVAYIGDDVSDIGLLKSVGLGIAVKDASKDILSEVLYVTKRKGGNGAVREITNLLLKSK